MMDDMHGAGHAHLSGDHHEHQAAIDLVDPAAATHVAIATGDWFNPAIWSTGTVPGEGARVHIPEGIEVTYAGESDTSVFTIGVAGKLTFNPDENSKLVVDTMVVTPGGELEIGAADNPVTSNIDIVIANNGAIDTNWDPMLLSRGIISLGDVSIHGEEVDSHIKVNVDPLAGDTSITLAEIPETWEVGDTIVIAGTDNPGHSDNRYQPEYRGHTSETREITAIEGNQVFFAEALEHDHATPRTYFKTSVANYCRNITFRSEDGDASAIHERGHVMFMGSDDVDVRYAAFVDLGRTDKSERSTPVTELEDVAFDSNVQGRYSLHLHKLGVGDQDNPIMIEGNAVIGSPGWGIAQHSSHANLYNNATLNIWGASYVSEAGDETGTWTDNISIGNVGTLQIERNHDNVAAGDIARTGNGFWMQSRMIETVDNIAVAARTGFVWIVQGSTEKHDPAVFDQPEAIGFGELVANKDIPIALAVDNEVFGSERGLTVTKGFPNQHHDVRTMIEGFDAWNVRSGILSQYTAHYTFRDIELIAVDGSDPLAQPDWGIHFGNNVSDMVLDRPRIDGFEYAYSFIDFFSASLNPEPGDKQFFVVGGELQNLIKGVFKEDDWAERTTLVDAADLIDQPLSVDVTPTMIGDDNYRVFFKGTKYDSLGTGPLPAGTDEYYLKFNDLTYVSERDGYWTRNGAPVILVDAYYTDRLTGEVIKVAHEVGFRNPADINNSRWNKSPYNGELPDNNVAPIAVDDSAETQERTPVVIDVLANDIDATTHRFAVDGIVQPHRGKVVDNGDGTVTYTPDPGFSGSEDFFYWVTDGYGAFTQAKVTVTVSEPSDDPVEDPGDPAPPVLRVSTQQALELAMTQVEGNETVAVTAPTETIHIDIAQQAADFAQAALRMSIDADKSMEDPLHVVFAGSYGHDTVLGGQQADVVSGGAGIDRLAGRGDADVFVMAAGTMMDIVYDFEDGIDKILLQGIEESDITVSRYRDSDTMLSAGNNHMILRDTDPTAFSSSDFITELDLL